VLDKAEERVVCTWLLSSFAKSSASVNSIYGCQLVKIVNNFDMNHVVVNRYCPHLSTFARVIHVNDVCIESRASGPCVSIWMSRRA
jgi:hypothetical protein